MKRRKKPHNIQLEDESVIREYIRQVIYELGETRSGFNYRNVLSRFNPIYFKYEFSTPENAYQVTIEKYGEDKSSLDVSFSVDGSFSTVTNENEIFKVMATVMNIVEEFHKNMKKQDIFPEKYNKYTFAGSFKSGGLSSSGGSEQRERLYLKFIKNRFPNASVERDPVGYTVTPRQS
jgi:hypothetical protein